MDLWKGIIMHSAMTPLSRSKSGNHLTARARGAVRAGQRRLPLERMHRRKCETINKAGVGRGRNGEVGKGLIHARAAIK